MKNNANLSQEERLLINPTDHNGQKIFNYVLAILWVAAIILASIYFPIVFGNDRKIALNEVNKLWSFVDKIQLTNAVNKAVVFETENAPLIVKYSNSEAFEKYDKWVSKSFFLNKGWMWKDAILLSTKNDNNSFTTLWTIFHKVDKDSWYKFSQSVSKAATECDDLFKRKKAIINEDWVIKFIDWKEFASANFSDAENKRYFSCWTITKAVKDVNSDSYYKTLSTEEKQAEIAAISFATLATQTEEKLLDKEVLDVAFPNIFVLKQKTIYVDWKPSNLTDRELNKIIEKWSFDIPYEDKDIFVETKPYDKK